jgi:hypothetical protein
MRNFYLNSLEEELFTPLMSIGEISYSPRFMTHSLIPEKNLFERGKSDERDRSKEAFHSLNKSTTAQPKARENIYFLLARQTDDEKRRSSKRKARPDNSLKYFNFISNAHRALRFVLLRRAMFPPRYVSLLI